MRRARLLPARIEPLLLMLREFSVELQVNAQ
jgi:hypothetical protein